MSHSDTNSNLPFLQQLTVERTNLLEKLDLVVRHKLTLIVAPPGYGKTTLAAQYAHRTTLAVAWHSVEQNEHDLPNLFEHCLIALSNIAPELTGITPSPNATAGELALLVTDHLRDKVKSHFVYVLDDVHTLIDAPSAESWLQAFIANMPSTCHLILIGRALPSIAVIDMIARREILSIGQKQLSFSFDEVSELAAKAGLEITASQIQENQSRLAGWPAGTLLALQPLLDDLAEITFSDRGGPEGLFDALAEVMLRAQPLPLQEFLLSSSTLSRMTPTLCQEALQLESSTELLTEALNRNLFITRISGGIVYHSLFRDFLQRQLQIQNPARFAQLHNDAGQWFETENRLDQAFEHYIAAAQKEKAAAIAERAVQSYLAHGKVETVLYWKTQLNKLNVKVPRLLYMCAMLHRDRYEYELADADLSDAEAAYRTQGNEIALIQVELLKSTIDNQRGNYQSAIDRAEPFIYSSSIPPNLRGYALAILGTAALYLGDLERAVAWLETALPLWRATGDAYAVAQLLMTMQVAYLRSGRFNDAALCVQEVVSIRRAFGEAAGIVMALNNLGAHCHLLGDYREALLTFEEGLQVANRVSEQRAESHLLWSIGNLQRDRGAFPEAANLYHKALQLIGGSEPFLQVTVLTSLATLRRWERKLGEALSLALKADALAERHNLIWEKQLTTLALCAVQIEQEANADIPLLEKILEEWQKSQAPQLVHIIALCTHAALLASDSSTAHQYLKRAIKMAGHEANLQPLIAEIVHTPALKQFIQDHASRYDVLVRGIRCLEEFQVEIPRQKGKKASPLPTYSLRVWALGQEAIQRDAKAVSLSDWQAAGARELFFHLLFRGKSSREQIGLAFWPDSSDQQIRQKFHTTLHRVRDAVGTNVILFENDLYSVHPDLDLWCDVFEFEEVIRQAQLSSPLITHTEILWRRAVELYRGDFLTAFDTEWVINYRELLLKKYLDALLALGECVHTRGDTQECIFILKRALQIDSYREDIHRSLLRCYATLGEHNLIVRHVDELTRTFRTDLGITPSSHTLNLSKTLLS